MQSNTVVSELVSTIDIAPTLFDYAEVRASLEEMIAQRPDDATELQEQVGLA